MPNKDGTGPMGIGAMTGRRNGNCNGARQCNGQGNRQGRGQGLGLGLGFRNGRGQMLGQLQVDELTLLQNQQKAHESRLDAIKNRISELSQK